ncbi:MAG: mechanosensitive ion channel family protein [Thermoplasmata archaeon]|nr:mechanosensitive ion channel family protein [Thermoplasmata archaeon]
MVTGLATEGLGRLFRTLARRAGARPNVLSSIRDGLRLIWVAVSVAAVVTFTGLASQLTVLTISGVAGLLISLSLQALFSNMVSGLLLLQDKAVRLGDVIEYGGVKGTVIRVALRNTWVRTEKGEIAIIGNSSLTNGPLVNYSAVPRFAAEFGD